ncbi:malate synthase G [Sporosarcina siberiensis]|uniref:Malate synthase G n=1 Tax=Sporosarcina siberiensis TaxID=1365606 RepID=A0ABW4SI43_9BACL
MQKYVNVGKLQIAEELYSFLSNEVLNGTGLEVKQFWVGFESLINDFTPLNNELLQIRKNLQRKIDSWHKEHREMNIEDYVEFLKGIGYLEKEPSDFNIETINVDDEVIKAGPQLVVPLSNARYAVNAVNARWGSLYDALYGTDVISEENGATKNINYNPIRGRKVIQYGRKFLDKTIPLVNGSHKEVTSYSLVDNELSVMLNSGKLTKLQDEDKFIGYKGESINPTTLLFENNELYFEIQIDPLHEIGKTDVAGVKDILMEAALTTILDCEDSVAAVDALDKVSVYKNLLGLMKGDLSVQFVKNEENITRVLNKNQTYQMKNKKEFSLSGRSLMFIRNVGHLMTNNAILDSNGEEIYEGILDGVITVLIATHSLDGRCEFKNSSKRSIYIVKPKMQGSKEVAFANRLFNRIEDLLGLDRNTIKIGVMDEERRTSLNLKACIWEVKDRIAFINTGFLDRTGDEIHTSMKAGPMIRKNDMKKTEWIAAYEKSNVLTGIEAGFQNRAQIGKGMWAAPEQMNDMLGQKIDQLKAGASTAWVPSPTAATLHALHYHEVSVKDIQSKLTGNSISLKNDILKIPIAKAPNWSKEEIQQELDNNAQGILGYVIRWVEQGIGCSKVMDINNIGLMEDRATLRISSQHIANWIYHGICTKEEVENTFKSMAKIVDEQNKNDSKYKPMSVNFEASIGFQAACELVFKGGQQPSGYTEPILHHLRLKVKER